LKEAQWRILLLLFLGLRRHSHRLLYCAVLHTTLTGLSQPVSRSGDWLVARKLKNWSLKKEKRIRW